MKQENLRKVERIKLSKQPEGELYLCANGERYAVRSVLNISPQGISVQLSNSVANDAEVEVQYKHKDVNLHVNGTVVWNKPSDEPPAAQVTGRSFNIGINLISPHLLFSLMQTEYEQK